MAAVFNTLLRLRLPLTPSLCLSVPRTRRSSKPPAFPQTIRSRTANRPLFLRGGIIACSAASKGDSHSEIDVEKVKNDFDSPDPGVAWLEAWETFKGQALKMRAVSEEAYELYSKKAVVILKDASEQFQAQSDEAAREWEESKGYLSAVIDNAPEIKDMVETYSSSANQLRQTSQIQDFHVGIPYGLFLCLGGFLSFMLFGSISAIRFGVILGGMLLALSILNMRLWKEGNPSSLFLRGQTAIALIIFLREFWIFFYQGGTFLNAGMTLLSGAVAVFFLLKNKPKKFLRESGPDPEPKSNS